MATASPSPSNSPTPNATKPPTLWPNQSPVLDGVVPAEEVPQDSHPFDDDDLDAEMKS